MSEHTSAIVLFSGGQDSATCLAWALQNFDKVITVGFDYGQIHRIELECRQTLLNTLHPKGEDHLLSLPILSELSKTAMTHDMEIKLQDNGLPNTFVPARNIMFLTTAAILAYRQGISNLVIGVCETDYSGYPDCRNDFIQSMQTSLTEGMGSQIKIHTPLMFIDKAATWELAHQLGGPGLVDLIRLDSHTCYLGERGDLHGWGYGCGTCPACNLRKHGYDKWEQNR